MVQDVKVWREGEGSDSVFKIPFWVTDALDFHALVNAVLSRWIFLNWRDTCSGGLNGYP